LPAKRKINHKRVIELAQQGIRPALIAKDQGVYDSTITRFLETVMPQLKQIQHYNNIKADVLSQSQLKKQTIEDLIVQNWLDNPDIIKSQDIRVQKEVLHTLQGGKTYDHQAERLERGQSTGNVAMITADIQAIQAIKAAAKERSTSNTNDVA
jgi:hypothetical protein